MGTLTTILVAVLSAMAGTFGSVAALWPKLRELRDKREESEIGRLRTDVETALEHKETCEAQLKELRARVTLVEHHHGSYLARWIKDAGKRVTWLNDRAVLGIFAPLGLTRDQVIGHSFAELLEPHAAAEIDRLDAAALAHPEVAASNLIQLHPLLPVMVVVKVAAIGRDSELVYEGYAYRTNDRMISDAVGAQRQIEALSASADHILPGG